MMACKLKIGNAFHGVKCRAQLRLRSPGVVSASLELQAAGLLLTKLLTAQSPKLLGLPG